MMPDYLILGHITRDILPDGSSVPGGTSLYAATTAYRQGSQAAIVSAPAALPPQWPVDIPIAFNSSSTPPTFENRYSAAGREQILHTAATPIRVDDVPRDWRGAPVVHLGPVIDETPAELVFAFPNALIGVTPQGWMRTWPTELPGPVQFRPWLPAPQVLQRINALVLSIEDVHGDEALAQSYAQHCGFVVVTRSSRGATVHINGEPHHIPAFLVEELDPTGAGDVFAASLFLHLQASGDPLHAARFAACAAALSVQGRSVSTIPDRATIERALASA